jgi:transcriptional regulator with XRE-family HTH domain
LTFRDARHKLLAYVRDEVRNGDLTERSFARLVGISQPHAHNVLKGARTLSPQIFDLILKYLHLSLLDLAPLDEIEAQLTRRRTHEKVAEIVYLEAPIGPGHPWSGQLNWQRTYPAPFSGRVPRELLMASLAPDPAMTLTLASDDLALLDTSRQRRFPISAQGLYVVERTGEAVLRYIRFGARWPYLVSDTTLDSPTDWEPMTVSTARFEEAVKARVVWLGSEQSRNSPIQPGRLLYDPISS